MTMQNPERVVTKKDLKDFYDGIYPYLGGGGGSIQVSEMPEASQSNEGKSAYITVRYTKTTD